MKNKNQKKSQMCQNLRLKRVCPQKTRRKVNMIRLLKASQFKMTIQVQD